MKTTTRKSSVRRSANSKGRKPASRSKARAPRPRYEVLTHDSAKLKVVGENTRREGSKWFKNFKLIERSKTVGDFVKKGGEKWILREAMKSGFVRIAA